MLRNHTTFAEDDEGIGGIGNDDVNGDEESKDNGNTQGAVMLLLQEN